MEHDRREFLKRSLYGIFALLGVGYLASSIAVLSPSRREYKGLAFFPLVPEDEVPRRGVKKAELSYAVSAKERKMRVFIVSTDRGTTVFSAICSHLGCLVNYNKQKQEFLCPCHGGRYDLAGRNVEGPPPAPLTVLPHRIERGVVMVGVKVEV